MTLRLISRGPAGSTKVEPPNSLMVRWASRRRELDALRAQQDLARAVARLAGAVERLGEDFPATRRAG